MTAAAPHPMIHHLNRKCWLYYIHHLPRLAYGAASHRPSLAGELHGVVPMKEWISGHVPWKMGCLPGFEVNRSRSHGDCHGDGLKHGRSHNKIGIEMGTSSISLGLFIVMLDHQRLLSSWDGMDFVSFLMYSNVCLDCLSFCIAYYWILYRNTCTFFLDVLQKMSVVSSPKKKYATVKSLIVCLYKVVPTPSYKWIIIPLVH